MLKPYFLVICLLSVSFVGCIDDAQELEKTVIDDSEDEDAGGLPGFEAIFSITAALGAALIATRRE